MDGPCRLPFGPHQLPQSGADLHFSTVLPHVQYTKHSLERRHARKLWLCNLVDSCILSGPQDWLLFGQRKKLGAGQLGPSRAPADDEFLHELIFRVFRFAV
jgi:hypothetical protein